MLDPQQLFRQMATADFKETATPKEAVPGSMRGPLTSMTLTKNVPTSRPGSATTTTTLLFR